MAKSTKKSRDGIGVLGGYAAKQCTEFVRKEFSRDYDNDLKLDPSPVMERMLEDGHAFEADVIKDILDVIGDQDGVVHLQDPEDRDDKEAMTRWEDESHAAFENPDVWFIINPRLRPVPERNLTGEPDAAIRSKSGGWHPVDVKMHRELVGTAKATLYSISDYKAPRVEDAVVEEHVGKPDLRDSIQLAHYYRMFEAYGYQSTGELWGAIIGRSGRLVWRKLDEGKYRNDRLDGTQQTPLEYYDAEMEHRREIRRREVARRTLDLQPLAQPEWKSECGECPWRQVCHDELTETDDISLLPGVTPSKTKKLRKEGVNTVAQLAKLDYPTADLFTETIPADKLREEAETLPAHRMSEPAGDLLKKRGSSKDRAVELLNKYGFQTIGDLTRIHKKTAAIGALKVAGLGRMIDQSRVQRVGRVHLSREAQFVGFDRARLEVDIDFEDTSEHTYMFGMLVSGRKVDSNGDRKTRSEYRAFCAWENTEEAEAKAFADFWNELMRLRDYAAANRYGYRVYHYTQHEVHTIKKLAAKYHGVHADVPSEQDVEQFMNSRHWVDIYPIVLKDMIWPTSDYTVKSIAKYARHSWSGDGVDGALSLVWYEDVLNHPDEKVREQRKADLLTYNRQDNEATLKVRDWITNLSETQRRPGEKLPSVADLDKRFRMRP